ncbi:uncharacterized protein LOC132637959 [Lycium barbarum]|uniref:uncharacterized protein LOC132637959 n=1 Tax=Lycium barbarum TaxID=112863 RepID=UPI00293E7699|nr:uncharacterized protein LOC132637959 [Lycium barbarum]
MMKCLIWNVRGINKRYKQKELKQYLRNNNIKLAGLIKTRVKQGKPNGTLNIIARDWGCSNNYNAASNGRIWIMWDQAFYNITTLVFEAQFLHCLVHDITNTLEWELTVIYGFNTIEITRTLGEGLLNLSLTVSKPWMFCGDFNATLYFVDRRGGNPITVGEVKYFTDCLQQIGASELMWRGEYFTWSNKQLGADRICSKIDRAFGNFDWIMNWRQVYIEYGLPNFSDHSSILFSVASQTSKIKVPFRFFNTWCDHSKFEEILKTTWGKNKARDNMENIWLKLKALKPGLQKLNKNEFKNITTKIEQARTELGIVQQTIRTQVSDQLLIREKELLVNLEKWSLIEESALQQKSKARWIKLGDSNTNYFSTIIKERTQRKQIFELVSTTGTRLLDQQDIKHEILTFYKELQGTSNSSLPAVDQNIISKGPVLDNTQQLQLLARVSEEEIQNALKSIGDDKSSRIDGYNAFFFKRAWSIIKTDLVRAVQDFFVTGRIYKPINRSAITLIPKNDNPTTIKEYSPIACCIVAYKVITMVLAARIQKVIASVICEAQAGFIPGRKIANNVILAHELVKAYTRKGVSPRCMVKIDLQKAHDSVEWAYIEQVLEGLNFPTKFICWIMQCVTTVSYSILINGELSEPFTTAKGLRQGDPISLFLFAIAMEYLSRSLNGLKEQ